MNTYETEKITRALKVICATEPDTIRAFVAQEALEQGNDVVSFFSDLLTHGCISGMVGSLIYYSDTARFFEVYYEEIEELRLEYYQNTGIAIYIEGDWKNGLAWFAFEETTRQIMQELELDL